jgi:Ty3 transposon capsid-like protein
VDFQAAYHQVLGLLDGFHVNERPMAEHLVKIHLPPIFHGERDPFFLMSWASKVRRFTAFYSMTPAKGIEFCETLLEGEADLWWGERQKFVTAGMIQPVTTVEEFLEAIWLEFELRDYDFELRQKLLKLYQNQLSVREYTQAFRQISCLLKDTHVKDIMHIYITHLSKDLGWEVMRNNPTDLGSAVQYATRAEDMMRRMGFNPRNGKKRDEKKKKEKEDYGKNPNWQSTYFGYGNNATPMDLDNVNLKNQKGEKKKDQLRKQLKEKNLCFKCHQPGHTQKFCQMKQGNPVGINPMAYQAWAQPMQQIYPAMPNMPGYNHKVNPRALGLHNTEVTEDYTQTSNGCCSHSHLQGNGKNQ